MKIIIFGGTTESKELIQQLTDKGYKPTVSVAYQHGADMLQQWHDKINILINKLDYQQLAQVINNYDIVIDATHPYATEITNSLKEITNIQNKTYYKVAREYQEYPNIKHFNTYEEIVEYLNKTTGNILTTTGVNNVRYFTKVNNYQERVYFRILPIIPSLEIMNENNITANKIIAMQGPFNEELNKAMLQQVNAKYLITKDSGNSSGLQEKVNSCQQLNVEILMLRNPDNTGDTIPTIIKKIEEKTMNGILILAHGSRRNETTQAMAQMVEMIKERCPNTVIENAFMELASPLLPEGLDKLKEQGITNITVIPYFLFSGVHINSDIPGELEEYKKANPEVNVELGPIIGNDPRLADIISERIKAVTC